MKVLKAEHENYASQLLIFKRVTITSGTIQGA